MNSFAFICNCEVNLLRPITSSKSVSKINLGGFEGQDYNDFSEDSQKLCRQECRTYFYQNFTEKALQAYMLENADAWIANNQVGSNCTGPTTLKSPVTVGSSLGPVKIGRAHSTFVIYHHKKMCF
jgi:hypothetical protein